MKVFIVHAHPEPRSFNGALRDTAVEALRVSGHEVLVSDLYAQQFRAVQGRHDFRQTADAQVFNYREEQRSAWKQGLSSGFADDIAEEQRRLLWCDLLVLQFPMTWFSVPAIMKGWFERVLSSGFAYGGGNWFETGPLRGRRGLVSITMSAPADRWGPGALFGPLEQVLWPIQIGTLNFCGLEVLAPNVVHAPAAMDDAARAAVLAAWRARLSSIESEVPLPFVRANVRYRDTSEIARDLVRDP